MVSKGHQHTIARLHYLCLQLFGDPALFLTFVAVTARSHEPNTTTVKIALPTMPHVYESAESDALNDSSNGAAQPVYVHSHPRKAHELIETYTVQPHAIHLCTDPQRDNTGDCESLCALAHVHISVLGNGGTLCNNRRAQSIGRMSRAGVLYLGNNN